MNDYMQDSFNPVIIFEHSGHGYSPQSRNNSNEKEPPKGLNWFYLNVISNLVRNLLRL